ncbi:MAG: hypothetical protein K2G16_02675 [Lachnospiraceae bacterium]|nr:hypothetical protein [Lachnospiraceae bacterium]
MQTIVTSNQLFGGELYQVVGIKRAASSRNKERVYTTYYCLRAYSDYELDKTETAGIAVEEVQTTEDFPIEINDIVKFYYGKAMGDWQPVTDYKLIERPTPFDGQEAKEPEKKDGKPDNGKASQPSK